MKTVEHQTISYTARAAVMAGILLLTGCGLHPETPAAETIPSIAETIPAETTVAEAVTEEPPVEVYVRNAEDAGEDDGAHPLDVTITEGAAGSDYPLLDVDGQIEQSEDIIAVLHIPCIGLTYPVYWTLYDNAFYLDHDGNGEESQYGCIEADGWNLPDFTDVNTIIYGHNMMDYSMFGSLKNMLNNQRLVDQDPYIYLYQADTVKRYQIYAFNVTTEDDIAYELPELNFPSAADLRDIPSDQIVDEYGTTAEKAQELAEKSNEKSSENAGEGTSEDLLVSDLMEIYTPREAQTLYNEWYDQFVANAQNDSQYLEHYADGIAAPDFTGRPRNLMLATCYGAAHSSTRLLVHAVLNAEYKR